MAVTALSDIELLLPVNGLVEPRPAGGKLLAGSFVFEAGDGPLQGWHHHELHQLELSLRGVLEVHTLGGMYLLPPQQAMWLPAGLEHNTVLHRVRTISVFLSPELVPNPGSRARIISAPPLLRELVSYSARWPIDQPWADPVGDTCFAALAALIPTWLDEELPLALPTGSHPLVAAAMTWTRDHLDTATVTGVARHVGVSPRTLRRAFADDAVITWQGYLLQARLLRAMVLLADPALTVLDVATQVGFTSVSAFSRAFTMRVGESPRAFRRRAGPDGTTGRISP